LLNSSLDYSWSINEVFLRLSYSNSKYELTLNSEPFDHYYEHNKTLRNFQFENNSSNLSKDLFKAQNLNKGRNSQNEDQKINNETLEIKKNNIQKNENPNINSSNCKTNLNLKNPFRKVNAPKNQQVESKNSHQEIKTITNDANKNKILNYHSSFINQGENQFNWNLGKQFEFSEVMISEESQEGSKNQEKISLPKKTDNFENLFDLNFIDKNSTLTSNSESTKIDLKNSKNEAMMKATEDANIRAYTKIIQASKQENNQQKIDPFTQAFFEEFIEAQKNRQNTQNIPNLQNGLFMFPCISMTSNNQMVNLYNSMINSNSNNQEEFQSKNHRR